MYENQKGQLDQQAFNMDQSNFALQGMKDNQVGPISCSTAASRRSFLFYCSSFQVFLFSGDCSSYESGLENYAEGVQEVGH